MKMVIAMKPSSSSSSVLIIAFFIVFIVSAGTEMAAPSGGGGEPKQLTSCSTALGSVSSYIPFSTSSFRCYTAWTAEDFILGYAEQEQGHWGFVLSAPYSQAYIAIGFSGDGDMEGSSAVAGWIAGGDSGIGVGKVKRYYLGGMTSGECPPEQGSLHLVPGKSAIVLHSSRLYLAFQLNATPLGAPHLIFAVGPKGVFPDDSDGGYLAPHRDMASTAAMHLVAGEVSSATAGDSWKPAARRKHGALAAAGWGVLMPAGTAFPRYMKSHDPHWFYTHVAVQAAGFALGVAGVSLGFSVSSVGDIAPHRAIGIAVLAFGSLQVLALLLRPGKGSKARTCWNWYHRSVGVAVVGAAAGEVFYGLSLAGEATAWFAGYGAFLGLLVVAFVVLEIRTCCLGIRSLEP